VNYPFIVLEGIDGVGKTTVARLLADQLDAEYVSTPTNPFSQIRLSIENMREINVRFHYYLCAVICSAPAIRKLLVQKPVVCDRYIASTIAYHRAMEVEMNHIDLQNLPIVAPSHAFLLVANDETRKKRIADREVPSAHDYVLERDHSLLKRVELEFYRLDLSIIDTSNSTPCEVVTRILNQMKGS